MKTLIIHPKDYTTDFLCESYKDLDCTIIRSKIIGSGNLRRAIKDHDKIIFLGHGDTNGLLRDYVFQISYLINSKYVQLLREKECVYVWCYADQFVRKYGLKGFATGMVISEINLSIDCCVLFKNNEVEKSNEKFAKSLARALQTPLISEMKNIFHSEYLPESNVEEFNNNNIFIF